MLNKKLVVILVLAALLVATQVAEVEAGLTRKEDKVAERDEGADVDKKKSSGVQKSMWQPNWP